jgi:hypothetical protein
MRMFIVPDKWSTICEVFNKAVDLILESWRSHTQPLCICCFNHPSILQQQNGQKVDSYLNPAMYSNM